jgi:BAI1-associated protein 3
MTTFELIDVYHKERQNDQQIMMHQYQTSGEAPQYGVLAVRVYFRNNCLFVEIIRARDVIPLDTNGLSDPFVVVELLPRRIFQCAEQTTHVQKATLHPVFDECFEL